MKRSKKPLVFTAIAATISAFSLAVEACVYGPPREFNNSSQSYEYMSKADVEEYVSAVKLEIRTGILYVTVYDGTTYKTTIEADEIYVERPEHGTGTVSTAYIKKDHETVMIFSRSYVQETNMTKKEIEEEFGPVTIVR